MALGGVRLIYSIIYFQIGVTGILNMNFIKKEEYTIFMHFHVRHLVELYNVID